MINPLPHRRFGPGSVRALVLAAAALVLGTAPGCSGGTDLSGSYEAKTPEGTVTLEFKSGKKVHMTMTETGGGQPDTSDGDFMVDGNKVTVQIPGGMPLILTRDGDAMDCDMLGQIMHFKKK